MGPSSFLKNKKYGYSFGKSKINRGNIQKDKLNTPGPGHYNSDKLITLKKFPGIIIPTSKKYNKNEKASIPGVGQYNVDSFWSKEKHKGFTMSKKYRFDNLKVSFIRQKIYILGLILITLIQLK